MVHLITSFKNNPDVRPQMGTGASSVSKKMVANRCRNHRQNMAGQISETDQIKQFKEFLGTYNKITENCFMDCIRDFTTREVKPEEITCSEHCLQKYLKMTQRISMRFQEYHIQQNEALAAKAGLLSQPR
ncbi:mitochondrial import inner membrane translocase subunit Tim9 isoform X1 [Numida meleagris]|nr:mitochondrial import inner membrane translocase subunit Tim9 isoform X1 [Numida meleagris]